MFRSPVVAIFRAMFLRRIYYRNSQANDDIRDDVYLTAIGSTPGDSSTHLHTNNKQNTESGTYITMKKLGTSITIKEFKTNLGSADRAPSLRVISWHLPYDRGKSTENPVRGAARTSQADTVQYKKSEQYNTQKKNSNTE
jgi:hypothetical protein